MLDEEEILEEKIVIGRKYCQRLQEKSSCNTVGMAMCIMEH